MSIDISQVPEILEAALYPYVLNEYQGVATSYQDIADVRPVLPNASYGTKWSASSGMGSPIEFEDGEEVSLDSTDTAKTAQIKVRQYGRRAFISDRMIKQLGAVGLGGFVTEASRGWGEKAAILKDDRIAGILQKGTLTAGSAEYFDNSYVNNADPNPKFIYDGLPFFDTAHTLSAASGTYANHTASLALSRDNLQTVLTTFESTNAVDERGDRISNPATVLVVPPALEFAARQILGSSLTSDQNQINAVMGRLRLIPFRALTDDADAWWVGNAGKGIVVHDSGAPEMFVERATDGKRGFYFGYTMLFGATVDNWRPWYCANKAAS